MAEIEGTNESETLEGTPEDDQIRTYDGDDIVYGGDGDDRIDTKYGVVFNVVNPYYPIASGTLTAYGGLGDDHIGGKDGNDMLYGGPGADRLNGRAGDDRLYGDHGHDYLIGGEGHDILTGGKGNDYLRGNEGDDHLSGGEGHDNLLTGDGHDIAYGNEGNDWINVGSLNSYINQQGSLAAWGGLGNDLIGGKTGDDVIYGGAGDDKLYGDSGDDILDGGIGADILHGGEGDDTYYIDNLNDRIFDTSGNDTAIVSVSFMKVPSSIEVIEYVDGAQPLPYWIGALLRGSESASSWPELLGEENTFFYVFPAAIPSYDTSKENANGYTQLSSEQQINAASLLENLEDIIDINVEPTDDPDQGNTISIALNSQVNSSGYTNYPNKYSIGSDIFLSRNLYQDSSMGPGTYAASTLVHELGHALGLKHPFDEPGSDGKSAEPPYLQDSEDHGRWTMMSYNRDSEQNKLAFSELDIAALQYLYGPSSKTRPGNDTYYYDISAPNFIWDGGGVDTIDASSSPESVTIFLEHGHQGFNGLTDRSEMITAPGQITVNFGTEIEYLIGSEYSDALTGNHLENTIQGLGGADIIIGGEGADLLNGGEGADELFGDDGDDYLYGGPDDDIVDGGPGNDRLHGGAGSNTLLGGSGLDYAIFSRQREDFLVLATDNGITVTAVTAPAPEVSPQTTKSMLEDIERLSFSDINLAFDLDGNAGIAAKVLGAFLGAGGLENPSLTGYVLNLLDNGMTYDELLQTAVDTVFGLDPSGAAIVAHFFTSLTGEEAPNDVVTEWGARIDSGEISAVEVARLVAEDEFNLANIDLIGLASSGLEYLTA